MDNIDLKHPVPPFVKFSSYNKQKNKEYAEAYSFNNNIKFRNKKNRKEASSLSNEEKKAINDEYTKEKNIFNYNRLLILKYLFLYFDNSKNKIKNLKDLYKYI